LASAGLQVKSVVESALVSVLELVRQVRRLVFER